jgi:hypothetical protein
MNVELIGSLARIRCDDLLREAAVRRLLVRADRRSRAPRMRLSRAFRRVEHFALKVGHALDRAI